MFYSRAIFIFLSVSELPLKFISSIRNLYIIFRLKNNTNATIFGFPNSPKINNVIISAQNRNTLKNFFSKMDIIEPQLLRHNFSFRQLSPFRGKPPQRKICYPYFLRNFCKFSKHFSPSYTYWLGPQMTPAWGCLDSPFGGGVKNKLSKRVTTVFFSLPKNREI